MYKHSKVRKEKYAPKFSMSPDFSNLMRKDDFFCSVFCLSVGGE